MANVARTSDRTGTTTSLLDDEPALIAAAQHDPAAFAPLYAHYRPLILGFCYQRTGVIETAEDLTQRVFVRVLGALPSYHPVAGASFRTWLFTIAQNQVIDDRRRARPTVSLDQDDSRSPIDRAPQSLDLIIRAEKRMRVRRAVSQLPAGQRAVVELRLAGLTGAEIAAALGLSIGAVKSSQLRAFTTVRTLLDSLEPHDAD